MSLQLIGYYLFEDFGNETWVGYRPLIFQLVFRKRCFFSSGLTWPSLTFWGNVLVSIEMLIMSVMGVINMSRQFFNTLVGMGSRSHDFDDELKISFLISSSDAHSKTFTLDLIYVFCTCSVFIWEFWTDSFNFIHKIPEEMITKWFYWCEFRQSRRWNSMQIDIYWIPKATGIVRIFRNDISQILRFSFCHHSITQVALMFVMRTI